MEVKIGNLTFTSKFDSGNLARVEKVSREDDEEVINANGNYYYLPEPRPDAEFNLWTSPDCAGSPVENGNRSWFYFGVRGWAPNRLFKFNIMNMNRQGKLYSQGHAPITRILPGRPKWERIRDKPTFEVVDNQFTLTFTYRFPDLRGGTCYFAFSYPWSYTECQEQLQALDERFTHCLYMPSTSPQESIYYHRELLCHSLDKLRIDLLTVSSCHGSTYCRETRFDQHLFPDKDTPRCYKFQGKKVFVLTSRVHPGETPGSFVFNGFLDFILRENDPRAAQLRQQYVFKLIPMLNPDGVMRGHYRTDQRGMNLNRMYLDPSPILHPAVYAAKSLLVYHHVENHVPCVDGNTIRIRINFPCDKKQSCHAQNLQDSLSVQNLPCERSGVDHNPVQPSDHNLAYTKPQPSDGPRQFTRRHSLTASQQDSVPSALGRNVSTVQSKELKSWHECDKNSDGVECEGPCQQQDLKVEPLDLADLSASDESASDTCRPDVEDEKFFRVMSSSSSVTSLDKQQVAATGGGHDHIKAHPVDSELRLHLSELNMSEDLCSNNAGGNVSSDSDTELTERLGNEGSEDEDDSRTLEGLSGNFSPHLCDPQLLEIQPHESGVAFYVDLHGHASKRGCFIYGNYFDNEDTQIENMLFAKLISINTAHFDFAACNFSERNMYLKDKRDGFTKEGSGRVAIHKAIGIIHSYTLECNYNMGRLVNPVPPAFKDDGRATPPPLAGFPPKYTPAHFEEVGRAVAVAALDVTETNPWSRVTLSELSSVHGAKEWVRRYLRSLQGWPKLPRNLSLKSINKNGNNGLPGKNDVTTTAAAQNTASQRLAGRGVGGVLDAGNRMGLSRQTSQNSASAGRRELGPVKEAMRNNSFSVRSMMRRHSSTNSSPPKLNSLSAPHAPGRPPPAAVSSNEQMSIATALPMTDTSVMRHFSADSTLRIQEEDKVQQLKNCSLVAIARRGGPPSRIPLPTGQPHLMLTSQPHVVQHSAASSKLRAVQKQAQSGLRTFLPVREKSKHAFLESADASLTRTLIQSSVQDQAVMPLAQVQVVGSQVLQGTMLPPSPSHAQLQESVANVGWQHQNQENGSDVPKPRRRQGNLRRRSAAVHSNLGVSKGQNKGNGASDVGVGRAKPRRRKRRGCRKLSVANEAASVVSSEIISIQGVNLENQDDEMGPARLGKTTDMLHLRLTPRIITLSMTQHQYASRTQFTRLSAANTNNAVSQLGCPVGEPSQQIDKSVDECRQ